jgi:hypothetical protein
VAERYPLDLADLLLEDPPGAGDLVNRLRQWRNDREGYQARAVHFSEVLRRRTWSDMAAEIVDIIEGAV